MRFQRIDHVGVVVDDLAAAKAFFLDFGLEVQGEGELEGEWVDQVVGLHDLKAAIVMLGTPDGQVLAPSYKWLIPHSSSHPLVNPVVADYSLFLPVEVSLVFLLSPSPSVPTLVRTSYLKSSCHSIVN
jgi:hypothetical protein